MSAALVGLLVGIAGAGWRGGLVIGALGLLFAALFGLTPELIVGQLRKQTDALKKELSSTEAAASGPVVAEAATH